MPLSDSTEQEQQPANGAVSEYVSRPADQSETATMSSMSVDAEAVELVTALGVFDPDLVFASAVDIDFPDQWWVDELDSAIGCLGPVEGNSGISIRSSIYGSVEENGRTYHRYKEGKYLLPNDDLELDRLDLQHALFKHTLHGRLYLAPIGSGPQRVLDICTGTGIWAIEFATLYPNAEVLGTDLSPIQPQFVPANCRFEIDDAEDEWSFSHNFDFIHGRTLLTCFADPASVIVKAFKNLVPGGYLEFQDVIAPMRYVGEVPTDSALYKWNAYVIEASLKTQRPWTNVKHYPQFFRDAGFEDVQEFKFIWPNHGQKRGKYFSILSQFWRQNAINGLEGISMKLFTNFLGWPREDVLRFLTEVKKDLENPSIQAYAQVSVVFGRKPWSTSAQA